MTTSQTGAAAAPDLSGAKPLSADELRVIHAYWRAANYLSVGQIYLLDNPLLARPMRLEDIKPRLLGHWGTTPGLNLIYAHAGRAIKKRDLDAIYVMGPGHGGPAGVANAYLEGTYSERYPDVTMDEAGLRKLFRQFSFPGGIPSHNAPETPGSIHEGGELGYALVHAYGAAFDNPKLTVFASSVTARPRPDRLPRAGTRTSSSTPRATARCCRSFTSTATRSPIPPCLRASQRPSCAN
jgi:xylulose-5-phosphate/fructose-6-phosphate phosphoketolase